MKGIVSCLADNPSGDGVLAAGTFTRQIGLYAAHGSGDMIATFSVEGTEAERVIGGKGITQVVWSGCGRYLYVVERKSDGVFVYDIRVAGRLVGWLEGRTAVTNQRLKVDVVPGGEHGMEELWAGGTDGMVRVWTDPAGAVGGKKPAWERKVHDGMFWSCSGGMRLTLTRPGFECDCPPYGERGCNLLRPEAVP